MEIKLIERRRYGKSTGEVLVALGQAFQNPESEIVLHLGNSKRIDFYKGIIDSITFGMGYNVSVKIKDDHITIKNLNEGIYVSDDGRMFKEID